MCYESIPDYNDLHREHEARLQREADKLPKCCECDQPIYTDECYEINGELICPQCLVDNHLKHTDDYIE